MSLDFDIANYCKSKRCTSYLPTRTERAKGYCFSCAIDLSKRTAMSKLESVGCELCYEEFKDIECPECESPALHHP